MKQIIVNVDGLTIEEKWRVGEALAKITGATKLPDVNPRAGWIFAPASSGTMEVTWSFPSEPKTPTHTPAEVLEMASAAEHIILADTLIITDSSGNIIYDSTPDSLNNFIKQRANGVSVKLDKNGAVVMVEKRKVRKDFDPTKEYSVDVSKCTEEEKKQVQQAFFDVGSPWRIGGKKYQFLNAEQYSNTMEGDGVTEYCVYGNTTDGCNMTAKEFLDLVYEPVQQGHVHAELMALYAEDAKTTDKPWELWQLFTKIGTWVGVDKNPDWCADIQYRRKPKTHIVHGVEVPDLRVKPKVGDRFYLVDLTEPEFTHIYKSTNDSFEIMWAERGLCYEPTEEGKQAAILHCKIMLGIYRDV